MKKMFRKNLVLMVILIVFIFVSFLIGVAYMNDSYNYTKKMIKNMGGYNNFSTYIHGTFLDNGEIIYRFETNNKTNLEDLISKGSFSLMKDKSSENYIFDLNEEKITLKNEIDKSKEYEIKKNILKNEKFKNKVDIFSKNKINEIAVKNILLEYYLKEYKDVIKEKKSDNDEIKISIELMEERINRVILKDLNKNERAFLDIIKYLYFSKLNEINLFNADFNKYKLCDDIEIMHINIDFILNKENIMKNIKFNMEVNGKTQDGKKHIQEYQMIIKINDVNDTDI